MPSLIDVSRAHRVRRRVPTPNDARVRMSARGTTHRYVHIHHARRCSSPRPLLLVHANHGALLWSPRDGAHETAHMTVHDSASTLLLASVVAGPWKSRRARCLQSSFYVRTYHACRCCSHPLLLVHANHGALPWSVRIAAPHVAYMRHTQSVHRDARRRISLCCRLTHKNTTICTYDSVCCLVVHPNGRQCTSTAHTVHSPK